MNLRTRSLHAFAVIARARSYTLAAEVLGITQSALSKQIKELETQVGVRLFDRTTRSVMLTPEGREFLGRTEKIMEQVEHSVRHVRGMAAGQAGRLLLAAPPHTSATMVPPALAAFARENPEVEIVCHDCSTTEIVRRLMAEDIEVAVLMLLPGESPPPGLALFPLMARTEHLSVAFRPGHPLEQSRRVTWESLRAHTLIQLRTGSTALRSFDLVSARQKVALPVRFEVSFINTALGMAAAGLGAVVMTHEAITTAAGHNLHHRRIAGTAIHRRFGLLHLADRSLSGPARAFAEHLRAQLLRTT